MRRLSHPRHCLTVMHGTAVVFASPRRLTFQLEGQVEQVDEDQTKTQAAADGQHCAGDFGSGLVTRGSPNDNLRI